MKTNEIYNMDCIEGMKQIPDGSVDCIICDLPYGTTACAWDTIIPFDKLWEQYKRIRKPYAPILLFGSEPFSTMVRMSNLSEFRYDWIWTKSQAADFVHAKNRPMKNYEIISAFCQYPMGHKSQLGDKRMPYNPQGLIPCHKVKNGKNKFGTNIGKRPSQVDEYVAEFTNYPNAVIHFDQTGKKWHPTQKPVELLRYLVRTYTDEGMLVLDNCMGSGSTAIACIKEKRNYIGFELNDEYHAKSIERIKAEQAQLTLF
jgi:site-specific DNA-methyltransferase (adenine-specific)